MKHRCTNPWTSLFVWKNGNVTHCCYSSAGSLGNINTHSIEDIWHGEKLNNIRHQINNGKYVEAGCEYYCRPFRWFRLYEDDPHPIPEGLGRISDVDYDSVVDSPRIFAMEFDGHCNMSCAHCLGSHNQTKGLPQEQVDKLQGYVEKAEIIRVMGGEFSVNPRNLTYLKQLSSKPNQPTVFLNTNGKLLIDSYLENIEGLESLHMKFSLEGMDEDYEKVRMGLKWEVFVRHLEQAKNIFEQKQAEGKDWRLYLNYCVMYSNYDKIPDVLAFAVERNIPLVINTMNGMRHIEENMFMFRHLELKNSQVESVTHRIKQILDKENYCFEKQFLEHYDYILRAYRLKKLQMSRGKIEYIRSKLKGLRADRVLYIIYRWQQSKTGTVRYLLSKLIKRMS